MLMVATTAAWINYKIGAWWWNGDRRSANVDSTPSDATMNLGVPKDADQDGIDHLSGRRWIAQVAQEAGFGTHLLIRLSPVPTMLVSYGCGAAGSRLWPYMVAAAVAVIPQSLWVIAGSTVADAALSPSAVSGPAKWISVAIAVASAVIVAVWIPAQFARYVRASRQASLSTDSV